MVMIQKFLFHRFISQLLLTSILKFNMFSVYKNNISKMFSLFLNSKLLI